MFILFLFITSRDFECSISGDGIELSIVGPGRVNQEIARSKGSRNVIQRVIVEGASGLENYTFQDFMQASEIILPQSMDYLGSNCFKGCHKLEYLRIPEGVENIHESTFFDCYKLKTLEIPKSLKSIQISYTFCGVKSLQRYIVNKFNTHFSTDINQNYLMNYDKTILCRGQSNTDQIIPRSVKRILSEYSYSGNLKSVSFEEGSNLEVIETYAFLYENIEELILPPKVKRIEKSFFTTGLKILTIQSTLEYFDDRALLNVSGLTEFNIGNNPRVFSEAKGIIYNHNHSLIFFIRSTASQINISKVTKEIAQVQVRSHNIEWVEVEYGHSTYQSTASKTS